jgi:hypothetical protein
VPARGPLDLTLELAPRARFDIVDLQRGPRAARVIHATLTRLE